MTLALAGINWDGWRESYDTMSFAEHQAFNAECLRLHPEQRCWNADAARQFFAERQPTSVVELGGWDGSLASLMLDEFPCIESWANYDISPGVPQVTDHPAYKVVVLDGWPWLRAVTADALVASHVFEHMRVREVEALVKEWDVRSIYVDTPLGSGGSTWRGYEGSHILEVGSVELLHRLEQCGYAASMVASSGGLIAYLDRCE